MAKKKVKKRQGTTQGKSRKIGVSKIAERLDYIRFMALPRVFRDKEWGFTTDEAFSKKYKVDTSTLYAWRKDPEFWKELKEIFKLWGKDRTPDVIAGMYKKAVSEGNAAEVKLWLQYFDDWKEKSEVNVHYAEIKKLQDSMEKLFEQEKKKM